MMMDDIENWGPALVVFEGGNFWRHQFLPCRQRTLRKMSRCKLLMGSSKSWWRSGGGFPGNEVLTGEV